MVSESIPTLQGSRSSLFVFLASVAVSIQHSERYVKLFYRSSPTGRSAFRAEQLHFMNVSLTPEFEKFIRERVTSGFYQTASEVVTEGLRILQQRDDQKQPSRQKRYQPAARNRRNNL